MNDKIKNTIFFLMCFTLIFNNIPKPIQMTAIGGSVGSKLVFYPLVVGLIYTFWCEYKYGNVLVHKDKVLKYLCVYLGITLISLLAGLYTFPYYESILSHPQKHEKLVCLLNIITSLGLDVTYETGLPIFLFLNPLRKLFLDTFYMFGTAYLIYCWYYEDWQKSFEIIRKAILASVVILFCYSFIELMYFGGAQWATEFLTLVNPLIHEIKNDGKWWPPLLWKGQLRSVFAEPSYFGMYAAFCLPFLWLLAIKKSAKIFLPVTCIMTFFLFLTKARTGFMLHIGELALLAALIIFFLRDKYYLKWLGTILLCSSVSFVSSNLFMMQFMQPEKVAVTTNVKKSSVDMSISKSMAIYIDSNAASLANPDRRSNRARYSVMEADLKIGLDHPLLGVGNGLRNVYIPDYFSDKALQNDEIKMWLRFREKLGVLRSGFPRLGEYTARFAETGLLGLGVFLFPPIFLIFNIFKKIRKIEVNKRLPYVIFLTSLAGIMAAGIGDSINITWCYWVLLGLGYAMCFGKEQESKDNL